MAVILGILMALVQLLVGLALAFLAIYLGLMLFDRIMKEIDLVHELKRGNTAMGVFAGGLILAIAAVIQAGVRGITLGLNPGMGIVQMVVGFIAGVAQLALGIVLAILSIYIAVKLFDRVAKGMDVVHELKNKNNAVAAITAVVLVAVGFVIQSAVAGIAYSIGAALAP